VSLKTNQWALLKCDNPIIIKLRKPIFFVLIDSDSPSLVHFTNVSCMFFSNSGWVPTPHAANVGSNSDFIHLFDYMVFSVLIKHIFTIKNDEILSKRYPRIASVLSTMSNCGSARQSRPSGLTEKGVQPWVKIAT